MILLENIIIPKFIVVVAVIVTIILCFREGEYIATGETGGWGSSYTHYRLVHS